jgi:hypothetical protein
MTGRLFLLIFFLAPLAQPDDFEDFSKWLPGLYDTTAQAVSQSFTSNKPLKAN